MIRLVAALGIVACVLFIAGTTLWKHEQVAQEIIREYNPIKLDISDTDLATWRDFSSVLGQFKVEFPAYPQHANEIVPIPNTKMYLEYNIYVAEPDESSSYMVSLITYPKEMEISNPENILQTVMNEMLLANPTNQLKQVHLATMQDYPRLDFQISNTEIQMWNRAVMVGNTLYLLTVTSAVGTDQDNNYERFSESFELLELEGRAVTLRPKGTPALRG